MITIDAGLLLPSGEPGIELLKKVRAIHGKEEARLKTLKDIYDRKHEIGKRSRLSGLPNNKIAHDLPGYIVTMSAGYLVGEPVNYAMPKVVPDADDMEKLAADDAGKAFGDVMAALKAAVSDNVDAELAVDAAVYGKGVEICYADDEARPRIAQVDPIGSYVVYDDTVEHKPLFGITSYKILGKDMEASGERVVLYTRKEKITYESKSAGGELAEVEREGHSFGDVPLIEYWNNSREQGDFEPVIDQINAYDALQSDRVNDKQQFTDSILALYGIGGLGLDDTEEYEPVHGGGEGAGEELPPERKEDITPSQRLRQTKTLFMPGHGAKAEWLTKPLSESDTEVLRKSLKDDIHKMSFVPDLTDESFAGNVSGVAMRFKLLGLEQLTKIKERWFREGLRQRLRLFAAFLNILGAASFDVDAVQITFKRSLPVNETEIASMVSSYEGKVSNQTLLGQVPFVDDPKTEMALLQQERQQAIQNQQALVGNIPFREPGQTKEATQEDDGQ